MAYMAEQFQKKCHCESVAKCLDKPSAAFSEHVDVLAVFLQEDFHDVDVTARLGAVLADADMVDAIPIFDDGRCFHRVLRGERACVEIIL
jgi:hypothetical protein